MGSNEYKLEYVFINLSDNDFNFAMQFVSTRDGKPVKSKSSYKIF